MNDPSSLKIASRSQLGDGEDTLVLLLAQNASDGNVRYSISIDGKVVLRGGTVTAAQSAGMAQSITIRGDWSIGPYVVTVTDLNDAASASPDAASGQQPDGSGDLYVDAVTYNGVDVSDPVITMAPSQTFGAIFGSLPADVATRYPLGAYVGNVSSLNMTEQASTLTALASFERAMGAAPKFLNTYIDYTKPIAEWPSNSGFNAASWAATVQLTDVTPVIGLPLTAIGDNADADYKAFASGRYDAMLFGLVRAWVASGHVTQYWRPGWEMNLNSSPTYAGDAGTPQQKDWIAAFQHVSDVLHAAGRAYGAEIQVVWNPGTDSYGNAGNAIKYMYPGDDYVDVIGADVYSDAYPYSLYDFSTGKIDAGFASWAANPANLEHYYTYPAWTTWATDDSAGHSTSLQQLIDLAQSTDKPLAIVETGAGTSRDVEDNPTFVKWLATTLGTSDVEVTFVNLWDSNAGGSYAFSDAAASKPLEAAAWASYFGAPAAALPAVGTLVIDVSEDAFNGDARFVVSVDGTQIGGVRTVTAQHSAGQTQVITLTGLFGTGPQAVGITFLNNADTGAEWTGRNLYVDRITFDGKVTIENAIQGSTGLATYTVTAPAHAPDILSMHVSEDADAGDAAFTVSVDGTQTGGSLTAIASHGEGKSQTFTFVGDWGAGAHAIGVNFLNDRYDGLGMGDRNLYVDAITLDGIKTRENAVQFQQGTATYAVQASGPSTAPDGSGTALTVSTGETLILAGEASAGAAITFAGADGVVQLAGSTPFHGSINGFAASDTVDLRSITFAAGAALTYAGAADAGVLTVSDGSRTAALALQGRYHQSSFHLTADGFGGTAVTLI